VSLHFIPAELSDATEISAILEEWYLANSWLPQVHDSHERAGYGRLLLTHSEVTMLRWRGLCVGFIALGKDIVDSLYIRSEFQRRGFGGAAMRYAQAQRDELRLWVFERDRRAQGFYLSLGFEMMQTSDGWGNDYNLPDVMLCWRLAGG
jgi:GNAT superfamily N-acetyltransferase